MCTRSSESRRHILLRSLQPHLEVDHILECMWPHDICIVDAKHPWCILDSRKGPIYQISVYLHSRRDKGLDPKWPGHWSLKPQSIRFSYLFKTKEISSDSHLEVIWLMSCIRIPLEISAHKSYTSSDIPTSSHPNLKKIYGPRGQMRANSQSEQRESMRLCVSVFFSTTFDCMWLS